MDVLSGMGHKETDVVSKTAVRIMTVVISALGISAVVTRPALAAIRLSTSHLAQMTHSSTFVESEALVFCGIGFLTVAFLVRRLKTTEKA